MRIHNETLIKIIWRYRYRVRKRDQIIPELEFECSELRIPVLRIRGILARIKDADPGGPKTYVSYGTGTLVH